MIELRIFEIAIILDYLGGPKVIRRALLGGRQEGQDQKKGMSYKIEIIVMYFEDGRRKGPGPNKCR